MFLGNRYEIISKIGSGGMADVYKAKCHKLNRFVAIKVLKPEFSQDQSFVSKFRMEAQSAACLSHPNIVNIYDVGEENGIYYIVMELIEGITLKKYIERRKKLEIRESIEVAMQVARGLEAAHAEHIIHRDIKPQNIMISKDGKVKVTDFGIARAASSQTISSNTMGSVHYISPEQARGGYCDERSDIYSLGITLYEMLTGRVPFEGDSTVAVALQHIQGEMVPPRQYEQLIPISLERIIMKCTQKKPELRYNSATELIEDLKKSLTMPNEDFVKIKQLSSDSPTMIFNGRDVDRIKNETRARTEHDRRAEYAYQMDMEDSEYRNRRDRYGDDDDEDDDDDDMEDTDSRFEKIVTYIGIGVAVVIVLIIGAIGLRACGLFSQTTKESSSAAEFSEDYPEGQIFEHDLKEGEEVDRSTTVNVKVSTGSGQLTIPSGLTGMTPQEAAQALATAGFTNVSSSYEEENSDSVAAGLVIRSNPDSGTKADKTMEIHLVVSKGPAVVEVEVPSLYGMKEEDARSLLSEKKLTIGDISYESSDEVSSGKIISQSPGSSNKVSEGSKVDIVISTGSSSVKVPDVRWSSLSSATAKLRDAGLEVEVEYEESSSSEKDLVVSQSPSNGSEVKKGTTVTIIIGMGSYETEPATTQAPEETTQSEDTGDQGAGQ